MGENILHIQELVTQAANNILTESDRAKIQLEINELRDDTQRDLDTTEMRKWIWTFRSGAWVCISTYYSMRGRSYPFTIP